jgi:hypothetical protein
VFANRLNAVKVLKGTNQIAMLELKKATFDWFKRFVTFIQIEGTV